MGRFIALALALLTSCASLSQLNRNMQTTNDLMVENIELVRESIVSVDANTAEIKRSTDTMYLIPFFGLVFLVVLFTPIFALFRMYRKLIKRSRRY